MSGKTFQGQVTRLGWEAGAKPRPELVDLILDQHGRGQRREIGPTVLGVAFGAVVGLLLKALVLETALGDAQGGWVAVALTAAGVLGLASAVGLAAWAVLRAGKRPVLLQFASINLLTLGIVAVA
ncbi:hypothetical protein [Epibacterium sp. Ofav1-8]|uniref:hypothetical protein n=1 Tax=Epibacterium sp. Ofav1-8 TaxID=2917735 RepID=UPI001EF5AD43